jgi:hypothetical protein
MKYALLYAVLLVLAAAVLLPFYWMVISSFRPPEALFSSKPSLWPSHLALEHYAHVLLRTSFVAQFKNSVIVAVGTTLVCILTGSLAGYSLSRFKFTGAFVVSMVIFLAMMFPATVVLIPLFLVFRTLKLLNTYWGLILAYATFALPFCTWMMKGFFDGIPREIEESALCMSDPSQDEVIVVDSEKCFLEYTNPGMARKLLREHKARVFSKAPFAIMLFRTVSTSEIRRRKVMPAVRNFTEYFKEERDVYVQNVANAQVSCEFPISPGRVEGFLFPHNRDPINLTQFIPFHAIKDSMDFRTRCARGTGAAGSRGASPARRSRSGSPGGRRERHARG